MAAYENDVRESAPIQAKARLSTRALNNGDTMFFDVMAEDHMRQEEGVFGKRSAASTMGSTASVVEVFLLQDHVKKTYTWELVREGDRWRIDGWTVEAAAGPATLSSQP